MDGDLDLLIGSMEGEVSLITNRGSGRKHRFSATEQVLEAGGRPIMVPGGEAGPRTADWDGDGLIDLLVSAGNGSVLLFRNQGTNKEPVLDEGEFLIGPSRWNMQVLAVGEAPEPGRGARIHVVDWNGDGQLDLLKGDSCRFRREREDLTEDEHETFLRLRERYRDLDRALARHMYQRDIAAFEGTASSIDQDTYLEEHYAIQHSLGRVSSEIGPLTELRMTATGYVWVYLRK
jgi:hypothetical protein